MRPLSGRSVVAEFATLFDADLAKARLASAGLEAVVLGDPAHSVAPHHVTERMFQLVVRDEVADHARDVLLDGLPPDTEADALDEVFFQRRFVDRPAWVRWMTFALIAGVIGPIAVAALMQFFWIVRGLFP